MANRMIRTLREQNWVLSRRLPKSAGIAVVLTAAGARYLQRELNVHARPGDNWGRSQGGVWKAPIQWQHELLVTILLVRSIGMGCEVKTELEVRAENSGLTKYPDGLIKSRDFDEETKRHYDVVQWLEVESADKSGAKMLALVKSLLRVSRDDAPVLSGWKANVPVVAFRSDLLSPSGKPINHQRRIESAIQRHIGADLHLYFQPLDITNAAFHVKEVQAEEFTVEPFDLEDGGSLVNRAFFPIAHRTFINQPFDSRGAQWTLKVYASQDRYIWEIWESGKPDYSNGQPKVLRYIEEIEQAFRLAIHTWRREYFEPRMH